jgi:hypothetical protein
LEATSNGLLAAACNDCFIIVIWEDRIVNHGKSSLHPDMDDKVSRHLKSFETIFVKKAISGGPALI